MKFRWMILTLIGTVFIAQAQNAPAPAAAPGPEALPEAPPGSWQNAPDRDPAMNPPGPGRRGPQSLRSAGNWQRGGPGEQFASIERGAMTGSEWTDPRSEAGGPDSAAEPVIRFEQGGEAGAMENPEVFGDGPDGAEEFGPAPRWGGGPGNGAGPGSPFRTGPGMGAFRFMRPPAGEALQAVLGLEDAQARKLRQLRLERAESLIEARRQFEHQQAGLMDLLEQEDPDGRALVSTVKSIHALRKQAVEIEKEFQSKTAATLNDEQRAKLKALQAARLMRGEANEAGELNEAEQFDLREPWRGGPGGRGMGHRPGGPVPDGPGGPGGNGPEGFGGIGPDGLRGIGPDGPGGGGPVAPDGE